MRAKLEGQLPPGEKGGQGHCPFVEPSSHQACTGRLTPYLGLCQPGPHHLSHSGDFLRSCSTQTAGPPKLHPLAFPNKWTVLAYASNFPKNLSKIHKSQTSRLWPLCALILLNSPGPGRHQWGCLSLSQAPPSLAQVATICRTLCNSCQVAPAGQSAAEACASLTFHQLELMPHFPNGKEARKCCARMYQEKEESSVSTEYMLWQTCFKGNNKMNICVPNTQLNKQTSTVT